MPCGRPGRCDRNAAAKPLFMKVAAEQSCRSPGACSTFYQRLTHGSEANSPTVTLDAHWASANVHDAPLCFLVVLYYDFWNVLFWLISSEIFPPKASKLNEWMQLFFCLQRERERACCRPPARRLLSFSGPIVMASSLLTSIQNYHLFHLAKQERKSDCLWFEQSCVAERLPGCCSWVRCPCSACCSPVITVMPQRKPNRNLCLMSESGDECNRRSCAGVKRSGGQTAARLETTGDKPGSKIAEKAVRCSDRVVCLCSQ